MHLLPGWLVGGTDQSDCLILVCVVLLPVLVVGQVRRCVSLFWGGEGGATVVAPAGCWEGYVCERSGAALPGLSWLLMTAMARTSRTPSPPASSSSTTPSAGSLTPPHPASPPPGRGSRRGFCGPREPLGAIVSMAALQPRPLGCSKATSAGLLLHLALGEATHC